MTQLSPETQAVLDAALPAYYAETLYVATAEKHAGKIAAAAIRTAAYEVLPREDELIDNCMYEKRNPIREKLLEIADELEGTNGPA
jgi:hypothetical protein